MDIIAPLLLLLGLFLAVSESPLEGAFGHPGVAGIQPGVVMEVSRDTRGCVNDLCVTLEFLGLSPLY